MPLHTAHQRARFSFSVLGASANTVHSRILFIFIYGALFCLSFRFPSFSKTPNNTKRISGVHHHNPIHVWLLVFFSLSIFIPPPPGSTIYSPSSNTLLFQSVVCSNRWFRMIQTTKRPPFLTRDAKIPFWRKYNAQINHIIFSYDSFSSPFLKFFSSLVC